MNDIESFGQWFKQCRRALDLTQTALAQQVGCAPVTIRKIEGDELHPSKQLAELLAEQLHIPEQDRAGFLLFARGGRRPEQLADPFENHARAPWLGSSPRRTNLPNPLTSFVGRAAELAEVKTLVTTRRLVTLTGPGGIGKTRLATQVAGLLQDSFRDGVWFIDLAPLTDLAQVPLEVAAVIGVREEGGRSLIATLIDSMRTKQSLLILDNCEHLILACAQLAETLLQACSKLTILATSRETLAIAGETSFAVPPLAVPDLSSSPLDGHGFSLDLFSGFEAVRLFVERVQTVQSSFTLTQDNGIGVARICQRLDGIPLAIELAAARLKTLSIEQVGARLDDRFGLLRAGSRTALPRHQTLQATIDWSYELLSEIEQRMLRRLSVFAGGWTLEAAEFVCVVGDEQEGIRERDVLDLLSALVDKSLVLAETASKAKRYRLLETIRQYAHEKLIQTDETDQVGVRHLNLFLDLAERAEKELHGPDQVAWLDRLENEYDNLVTALDWSTVPLSSGQSEPSRVERGLQLGAALWWFWRVRGSPREGRERLTEILSRLDLESVSVVRAKALGGAGALAFAQGDYEAAQSSYESSLAVSRQIGGEYETVHALYGLGAIAQVRGEYAHAHAFYGEALASSRLTGYEWGVATSLLNLGWLSLDQSDYVTARALLEESLAILRRSGDKAGIALSLMNLGLVSYHEGDYRHASILYKESLSFYRETRDKAKVAYVNDSLAYIELHQGNYEKAWALFVESLAHFREFGNLRLIADVLEGMAGLAAAQRRPTLAARLFGAAEALLEEIGAHVESGNREEHDFNVAVARARLDEATFTAAWKKGRELSAEQAIEYALEMKDQPQEVFDPLEV